MTQEERNAKLTKMWNAGESVESISKTLDIHETTIRYWRRRLGLEPRQVLMPPDSDDMTVIEREWKAGKGATQIGRMLNRTRNSVMGIILRRGWTRLGNGLKAKVSHNPRPVKVVSEKPKPTPIARVALDRISSPKARPFMERGRNDCAWPIGELPDMLACCNPVSRGSWCAEHAKIGYQPPSPARDRLQRLAR
ncbi:hypothetical protein UFOVP679_30 [uncultured Caudovirales phage]|uniref:GcrA cell cycle regulator n=1 Tax=uncultured Caudovirales phage TaxID=2100421 RepID=A0A6J5NEH0_9CAUD|nr:hypothetical protein UFOVP679_30 [uncultured Caudovirales phage]